MYSIRTPEFVIKMPALAKYLIAPYVRPPPRQTLGGTMMTEGLIGYSITCIPTYPTSDGRRSNLMTASAWKTCPSVRINRRDAAVHATREEGVRALRARLSDAVGDGDQRNEPAKRHGNVTADRGNSGGDDNDDDDNKPTRALSINVNDG